MEGRGLIMCDILAVLAGRGTGVNRNVCVVARA